MIGIFVPTVLFTSCKKDEETDNTFEGTTGKFTDNRDSQVYKWVKIGEQIWMAENLNYTTEDSWTYDSSSSNGDTYGRLYNWYVTLTACPSGWHLPTDEEWKTLEMTLGMSQRDADAIGMRGTDEGGKMREAGTAHWKSPNTGATNSSGFTALPGSFRSNDGTFSGLGDDGIWWSSSDYSYASALGRYLNYNHNRVVRSNFNKLSGFSVRCIKD